MGTLAILTVVVYGRDSGLHSVKGTAADFPPSPSSRTENGGSSSETIKYNYDEI